MTERRQAQRQGVRPAWPRTTATPGPVASERRTRVTAWTTPVPLSPRSATAEAGGPEPRTEPPAALIRLGFTDAEALARAGAAFATGRYAGFGDVRSDPARLTLHITADAGVETLRTVLAVLDAAAVTAESLTVHTRELDDVFAAVTGLS